MNCYGLLNTVICKPSVLVDLDDLRRQSEEGARFGFTGKQVIHPAQIDIVQQAYSPGTEKLKWAQELIAAFSEHQREGKVYCFNLGFRSSYVELLGTFNTRRLHVYCTYS